MSVSSTYRTMQERIIDELGQRTDLDTDATGESLTPIQNAIQDSIAVFEREQFYFNEIFDNADSNINLPAGGFSTAAGQEFYGPSTTPNSYALIGDIAWINRIHVTISNNRYTLNARDWQYLEDISVNAYVTGQPYDYAYFGEYLRFYPIPSEAWPITMSGTQRLSALVNPTDANAWTQDAEALIRSHAKLILARDYLYDDDLYAKMTRAVYGDPANPYDRGFLKQLKSESRRRRGPVRIRPTNF